MSKKSWIDNFIGGPKKPKPKGRKRRPNDIVFTIEMPKAEGNTFNWAAYRYR